jgi:hypothetical protein
VSKQAAEERPASLKKAGHARPADVVWYCILMTLAFAPGLNMTNGQWGMMY